MTKMEWKEVSPEQSDWKRQIDVMADYGRQKIGSIVFCADGSWNYVIDEQIYFFEAKTEKKAKEEMIELLDEYFWDKIDYYTELRKSLEKLQFSLEG